MVDFSIIIRARNEERWIARTLDAIRAQTVKDVEVVLVDNQSSDKTIERAQAAWPGLILTDVQEFRPGHALNVGIRASHGRFIVCLSAHCPPATERWLENLAAAFQDHRIAGVYGRQLPLRSTPASDKRDLLLTFGLDQRVQIKDTFFHNANSMIPRSIWEKFPFDETLSNVEDRAWGEQVIAAGYRIMYEPEGAVYHHHGIHHDNHPDRAEQVVHVMEDLEIGRAVADLSSPLDPEGIEICALIPLRAADAPEPGALHTVLDQTVRAANESAFVNRVIVAADTQQIADLAIELGAECPFLRPTSLSTEGTRVDDVLAFTVDQLEDTGYFADLYVILEITHPFRPPGLIDGLISQLINQGHDTVIAGLAEHRPYWVQRGREYTEVTGYSERPRDKREPVHIGLVGLGCVTYPEVLRRGTRLGQRLGIYELHDPLAAIEVRDQETLAHLRTWYGRLRQHLLDPDSDAG